MQSKELLDYAGCPRKAANQAFREVIEFMRKPFGFPFKTFIQDFPVNKFPGTPCRCYFYNFLMIFLDTGLTELAKFVYICCQPVQVT